MKWYFFKALIIILLINSLPGNLYAETSNDYTVKVNSKEVLTDRAIINRVCDWNDPQDTTIATFSSFSISGKTSVVIRSKSKINSVVVRPLSAGIVPKISGDGFEISLELNKPGNLMIEFNGIDLAAFNGKTNRPSAPAKPVFLFANPAETKVSKSSQSGLKYFGPGIHNVGHLEIKSNETIYIAEGATVYGTLFSNEASNIKITGKGILDGSKTPHKAYLGIDLYKCKNVAIDGIIIRDSPHWTIVPTACQNVTIDNVRIINYRTNGDGIDPCNCQSVTITNCFLYTSDDCISPKGCAWWYKNVSDYNMEDLLISGCFTINTKGGHSVRIGDETVAPYIRNIKVSNLDVYNTGYVFGILLADRGKVRNLSFSDIRVERYSGYVVNIYIDGKGEFSTDKNTGLLGDLDSVLFKNMTVPIYYGDGGSSISGFNNEYKVKDITFENVRIGNVLQTSNTAKPGGIGPVGLNDVKAFRENIVFK